MASYNEKGVLVIICSFCLRLTESHECLPGYYGASCDHTCGHCIGGHVYCDVFDGFCVNGCSPGFMGATCQTACPPTLYGYNCEQECPSHCKDVGCHPASGECSSNGCKPGFRGRFCNKACPEHTYGQGCLQACHCPLCGCHPISGSCYKECRQTRAAPYEDMDMEKLVFIDQGYTQKRQTRFLCQELETFFQEILKIVDQPQYIPLSPIIMLLFLIAIGIVVKWRKHLNLVENHENRHEQWDAEVAEQVYASRDEEEDKESKIAQSTIETPSSDITDDGQAKIKQKTGTNTKR